MSRILAPPLAQIRDELLARQYAIVPFPLSSAELRQAAEAWMRFLTLPMDVKQRLFVKLDFADRHIEAGYMDRDPAKKQCDDKELFHYSDFTRMWFWDDATRIPEARDFFVHAERVLDAGKQALRAVFERFEEARPGCIAKMYPSDAAPLFFHLRFLAYRNIRNGDRLAKPHRDKGVATLAVAESNPRLRIGPNVETLRPVEHREHRAVFFGGINFPWFAGEEYLAGMHDVIQEGDPLSDDVARWSMVLFADPAQMPPIAEGEALKVY